MTIFHLPDLGEGLAEAEIREWYVKVGDEVSVDQPLVSMETAKAVVDVPSPFAGKIAVLHGKESEIIKTGAPLISFEGAEKVATPAKNTVVGALEESATQWREESIGNTQTKDLSASIKAMPAARVLAKEMQIDLREVTPSGPQGLITVADVKRHLPSAAAGPVVMMEGMQPLRSMRRSMAQAMMQSHRDIVPVTIVDDADVTGKSDLTIRLLKAMIAAAKAEPALNAWFDGRSLSRKLCDEINIGLAVDTEEGLFVPVLKKADEQDDEALRRLVNDYKSAAAARTLQPQDMQGATITLSNFGTIAGKYATPIVIPPMVAILGAGQSREIPVVREGQVVVRKMLPLSLTFDHRAVTGGEATRFLAAVIAQL